MPKTAENARINEIQRRKRSDIRDIGDIPAVVNWDRRESCETDSLSFMKHYLPKAFPVAFSQKHLDFIYRLQESILYGGKVLLPIPRGFGKSTVCLASALWGVLYGHRRLLPIITAGDNPSIARMTTLKTWLAYSPELMEDFPEVCHPARAIGGVAQRAGTQLYKGEVTGMSWKTLEIVLPTIPELDVARRQCRACGSKIVSCGIGSESAIRGLNAVLPDGTIIRPDFVIIDDPQDEECKRSPTRISKLLDILDSAIMGLAGHKKSMSVAIACNILAKNDMIERLLDPENPNGFEGERVPLIVSFPDSLDDLWAQYRVILTTYSKDIVGDVRRARNKATEIYIANRKAMDAGCVVTWEEAFDENTVSGIQYAMNKFFTTPAETFWSEFQNQPLDDALDDMQLTADAVMGKVTLGTKRGVVPLTMDKLTCFVDVQQKCLFWLVAAWGEGFSGHVVDYGVSPKQGRRYFTINDLSSTLARAFPQCQGNQEALWRAGLESLTDDLLSREYLREDGAVMHIERLLYDSNDGNAAAVVNELCRQSKHPTIVMPYRSRGVTASGKPFAEYFSKPGDALGLNWRVAATKRRQEARHILADVNFWKSFIRSRWQTALAAPGSLTLFAGEKEEHRLFCEHMISEYSIRTEGRDRKVDEWRQRPNMKENHWWDCLVGAAVAASFSGIKMAEIDSGKPVKRKRLRLSELQAKKRQERGFRG